MRVRWLAPYAALHADHEQNASTSTVRIAGSSQANPFACIAAGAASLWGSAHGGANEAVLHMLEEIGSVVRLFGCVVALPFIGASLCPVNRDIYLLPRACSL